MSKYSVPYEGGCSCGDIRYRCLSEPTMSYHCYCRDCQRGSGSGYGSRIALNTPDFELMRGDAKCHGTGLDEGTRVRRYFCPSCGADVCSINTQVEQVFISVPGLDDPSVFQPQVGFWTSSAQPWVKVNDDIKNYETQPTMEELVEHFRSDG